MARGAQQVTLYWSPECPNCGRFIEASGRVPGLRDSMRLINISETGVSGLVAVPTLVVDGQTLVGTKAFEWLHGFEADIPLDAYVTAMGDDMGTMPYTDLETNQTVQPTIFQDFVM